MQFLEKLWRMSNLEQTKQETLYFFSRKLLVMEMEKTLQIFMNKPAYLRLSILEVIKIMMYEVWYDYVKPKYGEKVRLWNMELHDTDRFIDYIKTDIYVDNAKDVETIFDTSSYEVDRALPKGKK